MKALFFRFPAMFFSWLLDWFESDLRYLKKKWIWKICKPSGDINQSVADDNIEDHLNEKLYFPCQAKQLVLNTLKGEHGIKGTSDLTKVY